MDESREELAQRIKRELDDLLVVITEIHEAAQSKAFDAATEARLVEIKSRLRGFLRSL